jgi:hypothetical protein
MMTAHRHKHAHDSEADEHPRPKIYLSGLHKDWRTWLVIGIMLAAIATYVLTLDNSIQPGGAVQGGLPAAAAPAGPSK